MRQDRHDDSLVLNIVLNESQIADLARDAEILTVAAKLYVPETKQNKRIHGAVKRVWRLLKMAERWTPE